MDKNDSFSRKMESINHMIEDFTAFWPRLKRRWEQGVKVIKHDDFNVLCFPEDEHLLLRRLQLQASPQSAGRQDTESGRNLSASKGSFQTGLEITNTHFSIDIQDTMSLRSHVQGFMDDPCRFSTFRDAVYHHAIPYPKEFGNQPNRFRDREGKELFQRQSLFLFRIEF